MIYSSDPAFHKKASIILSYKYILLPCLHFITHDLLVDPPVHMYNCVFAA